MIEGLQLDVPAAELFRVLSRLIHADDSDAAGCELRMRRLNVLQQKTENATLLDELGWKGGFNSLRRRLLRKRCRHRRRRARLVFLRDHLIHGEVYRLGDRDMWLIALVA